MVFRQPVTEVRGREVGQVGQRTHLIASIVRVICF